MTWFECIGWLGNAAFFSRFFVQWLASERAKRSVAPRSFWWLSLCGALGLGIYNSAIDQPVLLLGLGINATIAVRNLWIVWKPAGPRLTSTFLLFTVAALVIGVLVWADVEQVREDWSRAPGWLACAVLGQGIWSSRFVIQWLCSEREGRSHFPAAFWWVSLCGNGLLLAYTIHLGDAVNIAGYIPGPLVQIRNLMLHSREKRRTEIERRPYQQLNEQPLGRLLAGARSNAGPSGDTVRTSSASSDSSSSKTR